MAVSTIQKKIITKDYSVTTTANSSVSPFGAYAGTPLDTVNGYTIIGVEPIGTDSANPVLCRADGGGEGFFTYSKSPLTISVRVTYVKD